MEAQQHPRVAFVRATLADAQGRELGVVRPWAPWHTADRQARAGCGGQQPDVGQRGGGGGWPSVRRTITAPLTSPQHRLACTQVAGYSVHYRGLVYATVRGAGHMVPETKPAEALAMLERFLAALQL